MRYRSLNQTGGTASAVSLILPDVPMREADRIKLIHAALESGINTFEIQSPDPAVAQALAKALGGVDRTLINIALRLTWSRQSAPGRPAGSAAIGAQIETTATRTGLKWLDMAIIDTPDVEPPPPETFAVMQAQRTRGLVRRLGVAGEGAVTLEHINSGLFDVLAMRFNVHSGWAQRNRIKDAASREMTVFACDRYPSRQPLPLPAALNRVGGGFLSRLFKGRDPGRPEGSTYDFLTHTHGWTPEQICLGYAMTEPAITSMQIDPIDVETLKGLAAVPERELPNGVAAQIEMARFSNLDGERPVDKRRLHA